MSTINVYLQCTILPIYGIKASEKRLKLFEYLRDNMNNNDFIFLQETHSLSNDEPQMER